MLFFYNNREQKAPRMHYVILSKFTYEKHLLTHFGKLINRLYSAHPIIVQKKVAGYSPTTCLTDCEYTGLLGTNVGFGQERQVDSSAVSRGRFPNCGTIKSPIS